MTLEAGAAQTPTVTVGGAYDGKIAGLYDLEETLGSGHFAVVKLARHVFTGEKVAVKVVDKTKLDDVSKAHLFQEVRCMKLVQHPNVVRLYEVIDTQTKLYLVLELGDGGDLYDYIMRHESGLSEDLARKYFRQILRAITYCHQLHVVHRDLKPENVVFFEKLGVVKLTDFGFSNKFSPGQKLKTFCGSLAYSAPEILLGDLYDAPAVDIWSLGVILYMLVCGQPPFEKANDSETLTMIMDCKYTVPAYISHHCRNLIASMLVRDPKKRATLAQIANNPWLQTCDETDASSANDCHLPLVSRQQISEEDHGFIIQKMINGNIAPKEEITESLDKNKYNHITATYFLLAEMRLRKRREENAEKQRLLDEAAIKTGDEQRSKQVPAKPIDSTKVILPISINVTPTAQTVNDSKTDKRSRKCSIVREEDEEESANEQTGNGNELKVAVSTRRESISDGRINRSVQERKHLPANARTKIVVSMDSSLTQKPNQIKKEDSSIAKITTNNEDDDAAEALRGLKELEIGKLKPLPTSSKNAVLTHRRSKLNKIRTPSCSSSEASDDDTKTRNKKKMNKLCGDTTTRFRTNRRDSHDDSSDSQDQLYPGSGAQNTSAANLISNSSNVSGKKGSQCKESTTSKNEETRKSHTQKGKKQQNKQDHAERYHAHGGGVGEKQSTSSMKFLTYDRNAATSRRSRFRESQSLDRITEAQEYELRYRAQHAFESAKHIESKNSSLINLNTFSVAQIKEEFDEKSMVETVIPNNYNNNKNKNNNDTDDDDDDENDDDEDNDTLDQLENLNVAKATSKQFSIIINKNNINNDANSKSTLNDIYNLNSFADIDLILEDKSLTKAIQVSGSKCFVTIKKIRRIGKYFPVINFS